MTAAQWGASFLSSSDTLNKTQIRRQMRRARKSLSKTFRRQASRNLLCSLDRAPQFRFASRIAVYLTNDSEIDTAFFIRELQRRNKKLLLPVLHPLRKGQLSFLPYHSNSRMIRNRFGIAEPDFRHNKPVPAAFISVICMPLVAFDQQGNRLGMGGGFYDRTLAFMHRPGMQPTLIGCAYDLQRADSLPAEEWDIPLHAIATEKQLYRFWFGPERISADTVFQRH